MVRTLVSIALCLVAMNLSLAFMRTLSSDQITAIRQWETYDIQIDASGRSDAESLAASIEEETGYEAFAFSDVPALLSARSSEMATVRLIANEELSSFPFPYLSGEAGCAMPVTFAARIGATDSVEISTLARGNRARVVPRSQTLHPTAFFATGDAAVDDSLLFLDPSLLPSSDAPWKVAVRADDAEKAAKTILPLAGEGRTFRTWKEMNGPLWGALQLEQAMVRSIFCLLLLIVVLSVRRSVKRLVTAKKKEIGMLRALGLGRKDTRRIFLKESLSVSFLGAAAGEVASILFVSFSGPLFRFLSRFSYLFIDTGKLSIPWGQSLLIALLVLGGTALSAGSGMREVLGQSVMEMMRDE